MAEKTYNTGRVVGWSTYEEFLKETGADPNVITNYIYQTLVTYGVTRVVELIPGQWVESNGGQFYTQTVRVPGASWGAVPIVGIDYESYENVFTNPAATDTSTEQTDAVEKADLEEAVGNIFAVYVSDATGKKATSSVAAHGYLTFIAYPDILAFDKKMAAISGATMKLIVRGLSMEDLDVSTLYYGPQGFVFAGNGLIEDCQHKTVDINNLSLNSGGVLWMSMGGGPDPADFRGLVNHPSGQILTSTFGYVDLDFLYGTGSFQNQGRYGLTYAEYQDALAGVNKVTDQISAIPEAERDDYLYLIAGIESYSDYPPTAWPFNILPVHKDTGRINVGNYDSFEIPEMKKRIDFTRLYTYHGDVSAVLYLYDKKLPDYLGSWWGSATPSSKGLSYTGNYQPSWSSADYSQDSDNTYTRSDRQACWKIKNAVYKGHYYIYHNQSEPNANGLYLCTKDTDHGTQDYNQLNRVGSYIPWSIPQWVKDDKPAYFEIDLTGITYSIESGVLYVQNSPVYPGEPAVIGIEGDSSIVYIRNTIQNNQVKLIASWVSRPLINLDSTASQNISTVSDIHSRRIRVPRAQWDAALGGSTVTVKTGADTSYTFTLDSSAPVTSGILVRMKHQKASIDWSYDKEFVYIVLDCDSDYVQLVSGMVWIDNPTLTATVGHPGLYDAIIPRYKQTIPDANNSYYYNVKAVLSKLSADSFFQDFGWNIADYVHSDYQNLSLGEFLREAVIRKDLTVPPSPTNLRPFGIESKFQLYSVEDLHYTSGVFPRPTDQSPISASVILSAKTSATSFFDTTWYDTTKADGTAININNSDYPIWVTVAKSRNGPQTMSVSVVDGNAVQLDFSGNSGDIEADKITWLDLLIGLGTGQAIDLLRGMKVRRMASDCNYLITADGTRLYISTTEPTPGVGETIPDGSIGIGW